jgi:hypothetical protein
MNYGLRKPTAGRVFDSRRMNKIRSESGAVSLNELLVAAPIMLMVLIALFVLYNEGVKGQSRTAGRTRGLAQQQLGVEKISKELRQATTISPVSSQIVDMDTYVAPSTGAASTLRRVRYDCSAGSCKRYEGPAGGTVFTAGPIPTITDVRNPNVFGMEPDFINPVFVNFTVQVDVSGQSNPIELSGGVQLRNLAREN